MPDIDLGDFEIDDDEPNLVIRDPSDNIIFEYDEAAGEWQLGSVLNALTNDITNVGAFDATSATVSNSPSAANDVAIKDYVDSVAQGLDWQDSVIDEQNDPPSSPSDGDRYLVDDNPTGDWSSNPNDIAEWDADSSSWEFFDPNEGWATFLEDVDLLKVFNNTDWIEFGSAIDHGALAGLGDDDHTQYLLVSGTRAMSGALDMGSNAITNATTVNSNTTDTNEVQNQDYNESVDTRSGVSGTQTVDLSVANWYEIEADGNITIEFSNVTSTPPGNSVVIYLNDSDGTGPHTVSWPASVVWNNGNVVDEIPSGTDREVTLLSPDGGSTWRARKSGEDFA